MGDDPNIVVFARPTPTADRIAFGICGVGVSGALLYCWGLNGFAIPNFDHLSYTEIGLLTAWIMAGVSLLAVALRGGTLTVTIDRRQRQLSEVAKIGPFTAANKTAAFKDLGKPALFEQSGARFVIEVPVKGRVAVQIGIYETRVEAEAVLRTITTALDVEEPLAEAVNPAAINALKSGTILPHGPGPLSF